MHHQVRTGGEIKKGPNYWGEAHGLLTAYYTTYTFLVTVYMSPWHITYSNLLSSIQDTFGLTIVLCSLEQEGGGVVLLVGKHCYQPLSSKSGILWI